MQYEVGQKVWFIHVQINTITSEQPIAPWESAFSELRISQMECIEYHPQAGVQQNDRYVFLSPYNRRWYTKSADPENSYLSASELIIPEVLEVSPIQHMVNLKWYLEELLSLQEQLKDSDPSESVKFRNHYDEIALFAAQKCHLDIVRIDSTSVELRPN
jgi:hypothetical protein